MTHNQLVRLAEKWLRKQGCHIILTEQTAYSGEVPDAIGWKTNCHSIVVECKISRSDFSADTQKKSRLNDDSAMGCERFYLTPFGLLQPDVIPQGWGLLQLQRNEIEVVLRPCPRSRRKEKGLRSEMGLLLASLRRVEVRIEPQTITEFLKWKNRLAAYNGGSLPEGLTPICEELRE